MAISATQLLRLSRQFGQYYSVQFGPFLSRTGLTRGELDVLAFLANNPGLDTARDAAEVRKLAKSRVSQAVELLAARGFLLRRPDGRDRRVIRLAITEAGWTLAREIQAVQTRCLRAITAGLTEEERGQLSAILEKMILNAEALTEGEH